jgi:flagellar biosynthetic protein FliO
MKVPRMKQCLALFLFFFTPLFGEDTINEVANEGQSYNYWSEFVNMLVTLVFVLILIFATVWLLKKIMRSRVQTLNRSNGIKILERRPLNPKAALYLVDILGKGVVLSESQAGIHLVAELPDTVNAEELLEQLQEVNKPRVSFKEIFAKKMRKAAVKNDG